MCIRDSSGVEDWTILRESSYNRDQIYIGDFTGDGISDIAVITPDKVLYTSGGVGDFVISEGATFSEFGFLIGDFNGDGKDDIFNGNGEEWRVMYAGIGKWEFQRKHATLTSLLKVGNFKKPNQTSSDPTSDIFRAFEDRWMVWYGAAGGAQQLNRVQRLDDYLLGDFNADGTSEVFRIWRNKG